MLGTSMRILMQIEVVRQSESWNFNVCCEAPLTKQHDETNHT